MYQNCEFENKALSLRFKHNQSKAYQLRVIRAKLIKNAHSKQSLSIWRNQS